MNLIIEDHAMLLILTEIVALIGCPDEKKHQGRRGSLSPSETSGGLENLDQADMDWKGG